MFYLVITIVILLIILLGIGLIALIMQPRNPSKTCDYQHGEILLRKRCPKAGRKLFIAKCGLAGYVLIYKIGIPDAPVAKIKCYFDIPENSSIRKFPVDKYNNITILKERNCTSHAEQLEVESRAICHCQGHIERNFYRNYIPLTYQQCKLIKDWVSGKID